ncbi:MAG: ABC transporter permease [Chloroflexi bacterium]|nr:ABC transporter permease [Chloroflexota bacterium]MCL5075181.1 ABC transporter permease [Chloroflexota bacterium]
MTAYIAKRLLMMIPILLGVSIITFLVMRLLPGNVVEVLIGTNPDIPRERILEFERMLGLHRPLYIQYFDWLSHVIRGDLGHSLRTGRPVLADILQRLPLTAEIAIASLIIALSIGLPAGIISAVKRNSLVDLVTRLVSLVGLSLPNFWLATMLILLVSYLFHWLPHLGWVGLLESPVENIQIIILPSLALGVVTAAIVMRMVRSSFLDVYTRDYILTARAKGLTERIVIYRHALKNALIPVVTVVGVQMGYLLGGTIIVEEIFGLPGVGRLVLYAIYQRDYPLVQGGVLFVTVVFVLVNLVVDILYAYLDPRITYE